MNSKKQKELISRTLGVGKSRIKLNPEKSEQIKEAITRADLKSVVGTAIIVEKKKGVSRKRARDRKAQQRKGRRKGAGSKKGAKYSRITKKELWMNKVRVQREFLSLLKEKKIINNTDYRKLYAVLKGVVDAGLKISHDEKILPNAQRLKGEHIKNFDASIIQKVKKSIDTKVK